MNAQPKHLARQRGFTLVEFMVASAVAGILTLGVLELLRGQIAGYDRQQRVQDAQTNVRAAMETVIDAVAPAGFGIAPEYAFGANNANNRASQGAAPEAICAGTDVLEVRSRNPVGYWRLSSASFGFLNLSAPLPAETETGTAPVALSTERGGYVFAFVSPGKFALVRVNISLFVPPGATAVVAMPDAESQKLADYAPTQGDATKVKHSRFFVSCANPAHPRLMVDAAVDANNDGNLTNDAQVVADDIEDLQVAFLLDADQDNILSNAEIAAPIHGALTTAQRPMVKAVRVSLVGRSNTKMFTDNGVTVSQPPVLEDHTPTGTQDALSRRVLQQTILLDNRDTSKGSAYNHFSNRYL
jgi:prepilin-type N-terminal cleavage/methylation domain-containing protein